MMLVGLIILWASSPIVFAQQAGVTFLEPAKLVPPSPMFVVGVQSKKAVTIAAVVPPGSREMLMRDAHGVQYRCNIPDPNQTEVPKNSEEPSEEPPVPDAAQLQAKLTKTLKKKLGRGCFAKTIDYWTYEVCPWRKVTQFHKEGNTMGLSFSLGKHDPSQDNFGEGLQLTQNYLEGKDGRVAKVTYTCNPSAGSEHQLTSVREPQERVYHFEILSPSACVDGAEAMEKRRRGRATPLELLRPMENQCVSLNTGWWTYRFCFLKDVTQMHYEPVPVAAGATPPTTPEMTVTVDYSLGKLPYYNEIEQSGILVKGDTPEESYFKQVYRGGTVCDIGNKQPRETEVRFYCSPTESAVIKGVNEVGSCSYMLHLHTSLLCSHPAFEPKAKKAHEIVCLPVTSDAPAR